MAGNDLNVKVDATTTGYERAIARAQQATLRYDADLKKLESDMMKLEKSLDDEVNAALQRQHDAMSKVGKAAFTFGAAVVAGFALATNEAVKWETAWTGVTKTVDGSAQQMDQLEAGLRTLATQLPATHEEIAAVAEAAGQLGIQRESILGFTKTMIDLSETTNLTADQAATDMARFANIMQTPQDQIDRLGASLVALGNDGASTEAEILSMAMRIAGAGAQLGLSEGEVMGLANALSSVGIEAEAGGSAISTVMKNMQVAVSQGGDSLAGFAHVAGMSVDEFKQLWQQDAAAGLNAFVTGLGNISAAGGDVIGTLQDMGITQIRQSDALLRLAGAGDLLTESLELGNKAWDENSALLIEANKRYETTAAKVEMARNQLRDAAIDVGGTVLPALAGLAEVAADLMRAWQDLPGPLKTSVTVLGLVAGAVALLGGAALMAVPKIAAFKTAVDGLESGALKTAGTRLMGLGGFLMGPWGVALAAGTTALGIFAAKHGDAARAVDALKQTLDEQTGAITDNSREWAIKELSDSGALQAAKDLGINLSTVTDAALGNQDALASVNGELERLLANSQQTAGTRGGRNPMLEEGRQQALELQDALNGTNGTLDEAREKWQLEQAAKGDSAGASKKATDAQKGTTQAWQDGADAAGDLGEEVKTLGEELGDLNENYLDNREAGRAVRDSLRDIREALKAYRKEHGSLQGAFKQGTKSGDDFMGMLDGLAKDYVTQIETVERVSGSEKRVQAVYDRSRRKLIEVATQLGMTRREAKDYADQVLGTPDMVKTHFETPGLDQAKDDLSAYRRYLDNLPPLVQTTIQTNRIIKNERQLANADGGIVQAFAGGGFTQQGQYVARVPQVRRGGNILWAEPETGWEAYISGKPGMEARNREVWLEAGRRLGMVPAALQQAFTGGRSFDRGGFAGGGLATLARQIARSTTPGPGPIVGRFTITNWQTGEGYMRQIARDELADDDAYTTSRGRMNR